MNCKILWALGSPGFYRTDKNNQTGVVLAVKLCHVCLQSSHLSISPEMYIESSYKCTQYTPQALIINKIEVAPLQIYKFTPFHLNQMQNCGKNSSLITANLSLTTCNYDILTPA